MMLIPERNWEMIAMDFLLVFLGFWRSMIPSWLIVDRLTESIHFILVKVVYNSQQLGKIYVKDIVWFAWGAPFHNLIRDCQFTSKF